MMQQPGRMRLRQWLEEQIHSGRYPGVSWLDQSAQIFQIPWKHAARHGWSIDRDATLFRSWAMHTGRYRPDRDKPDPKTWKANFRCALNSLPDICELPERSRKRGTNAHRVYRMMPSAPTRGRRRETRLLSGPRGRQSSSGEDGHTWQPTTRGVLSDAPQTAETPAGDSFGSGQTHGTWEAVPEDREQDEAALKSMDHLSRADLWNQTGEQRGWKTYTLLDQCHCAGDGNSYPLHSDNCNDLFGPNCIRALCDWSTHNSEH